MGLGSRQGSWALPLKHCKALGLGGVTAASCHCRTQEDVWIMEAEPFEVQKVR